MPINDFAELLRMVTADSKDDGKEFTVRDRLAVIGQLLAGSNYRYFMVFESKSPDYSGAYSYDRFMEILKGL